MLNGLDLFSGIGGITLALSEWVKPVAYCEIDRYAQGVLLSRMSEGQLPRAPIWDDVSSLRGKDLPEIDIIYGGFPCQDISVAGRGRGLEGERSGLFFEIMRLVNEIRPTFLFLENVPAITTRGLGTVTAEITKAGYDCRWTTLSAAEVGAPHKRERWWLLGYSKYNGQLAAEKRGITKETIFNDSKRSDETSKPERAGTPSMLAREIVSHTDSDGIWNESRRERRENGEGKTEPINDCEILNTKSKGLEGQWQQPFGESKAHTSSCPAGWWSVEPNVGRVAHGIPNRVDRIKGLGNAVVPLCAKEAFKELMGI